MFACLGLKNWIFILEHGSLHGEDSWSSEGMLKVEGLKKWKTALSFLLL